MCNVLTNNELHAVGGGKKKSLSIELISKYRSQIMGFAILWVMVSHVPIPCGDIGILSFFQYIGFGGVELFMIVSGFGLFFAMRKTKTLMEYYIRRFVRIVPVWLFSIVLLYFFCNSYPLFSIDFLRRIGQCWWYIPFILIIYAVSPIVYKAINAEKPWLMIAVIFIVLLMQVVYKLSGFSNIMINLAFARFFDFVIGMWFAKLMTQGKKLDLTVVVISGVIGLVVVYCLQQGYLLPGFWHEHYDLRLYPMILVGPMFCYLVIAMSSLTKYISTPLRILGECTLEIYLCHVLIWWITRDDQLLPWYLFYPVSLIASYLVHLANKKVSGVILQKLK